MPLVKLYLLGAPYLELDGEPVTVDTRKAIALLAYCAITAGGGTQSHTRDALAALLWPDLDQSRARAALRRTLSPLRRALRRRVLNVTRETISIKGDAPLWVDALEFRRLLSDAEASPGDQERRQKLQQAVELYGDDFMAGFTLRDSPDFDEWQYFESEQLRRSLAEALEQLTEIHAQSGNFEQAITASHRHLSLDPLAEQAHRNLMRLYAWTGQRSMAVRQYRECVRVLEQELGVPPLDETTALYEKILADELPAPVRPQTVRGPGSLTIESGNNTLQITDHTLHPTAVRRPPSAIDLLPLIGREHELSGMHAAYDLARERGHLLVIEGEAGVGKTRIAQEFVTLIPGRLIQVRCYEGEGSLTFSPFIAALRQTLENAPQDWRERVPQHWLAEAARLVPELDLTTTPPPPLTGPGAQSRFFEAVCRVILALAADGDRRSLAGVQKSVRSSESHPGILFLDDAHWADDASLDLLAYLVKRLIADGTFGKPFSTPLLVLVTWRSGALSATQRLHLLLSGAQRANAGTHIRLQRLSPEHVEKLAETSAGQSPTKAFARRLYRETEGLPFFVVEYLNSIPGSELAQAEDAGSQRNAGYASGAGVQDSSEASYWEMLESSLPQLPPAGVRSLIEERLQGLDEVAWQLLNAAAVIGRSFNFDICRLASGRSEEEAVAALDMLLARGLIEEVPAAGIPSSETPAAPQYDFSHNQIRALVYGGTSLARRRLLHRRVADALVQAPSRSLHATGYGGTAKRSGIAGQIAHHYRLAGQDDQAANYFKLAGEHARDLYANRTAVAHLRAALDLGHPDVAALHEGIGDLQVLLGEYDDALSSYDAAAAHGAAEDLARLEHKLGNVHARRGDLRLAQSHYEAALAQARATKELSSGAGDASAIQARIYADCSLAAHHQSQPREALSLADEARRLARQAQDVSALAQAHNILGILARHAGDLAEAQRHLQKSLDLATASGQPSARIAALNNLALVYGEMQARGHKAMEENARAAFEEALSLCQELGDRHREAALLNNLADLHHAAGHPDEAMGHLKRAAAIFAEIGGDVESWQPEIWKLTEW